MSSMRVDRCDVDEGPFAEEIADVVGLMETLDDAERHDWFRRFAAAVVHLEHTGHVDPLLRFARSVRASLALRENPAYQQAMRDAEDVIPAETQPVEDAIARFRALRAR